MRGKDIKRYSYEWAGLYLICTHNGYTDSKGNSIERIKIGEYPAIKEHLDSFGSKLIDRTDQGDTPYNLRSCAYMDDFNKPKIVYQELTKHSSFVYDFEDNKFIIANTGYLIVGNNLDSLIKYLNSKIVEWIFKHFYSVSIGQSGIRWLYQCIIQLPIPQNIKFLSSDENDIEIQVAESYSLDKDELKYILNLSIDGIN